MRVNDTIMIRSGSTIEGSTVEGFDCTWCSVRHQRTEKYTMGTLRNPTLATNAAVRARVSGSSMNARNTRYPANVASMIAVVVSRGSQVQYVPQVGRPHKEPLMSPVML